MMHRVISNDGHPARVLEHIKGAGCICRTETTNYRGPIAFVGAGCVWGVAELRDVKPVVTKQPKKGEEPEPPIAWLWCFDGLQTVEAIACARYAPPAMFMNSGQWEPQHLQTGAQVLLNRALSSLAGQEQPQMASGVSVPTEAPRVPELASCAPMPTLLEMMEA
ncbi:hypothetical protein EON83_12470 [bacterium]|nr:MAG: hypothetical protein EON83_12470 [bacterium]